MRGLCKSRCGRAAISLGSPKGLSALRRRSQELRFSGPSVGNGVATRLRRVQQRCCSIFDAPKNLSVVVRYEEAMKKSERRCSLRRGAEDAGRWCSLRTKRR